MEETALYHSSIFLLFLMLAVKLLMFRARRRHRKLPPSPPAMPIIGHLHLIKPPAHRFFYNLSKKYGPIFSLRVGSRLVIVVSSAKDAEECFTKNDIVFANRPKSLSGKHISYNYTTILTAPYGDHWRNLRRITAIELLSSKRVNMSAAIRREEIKRLLKKLSTYNSRQEFKKVELKTMFSELTFNITMRMIAGKRYYGDNVEDEEEARRFRDTVKEVLAVNETSNPGDFLPFLNWIGDFEKRILRLSKTMDTILQGLVDQHRNKKAGLESMDTMIDHMLSLQESQPQYYTDQNIKALMLVILFFNNNNKFGAAY